MGPALHLMARLYGVEDRSKGLTAEERLALRQRLSAPVMEKLHKYVLEIRQEVLPKSPAGAAVRYALNQWEALTRFLEDGDLEIDNGASERANRPIAIGRGNWTFFGSDNGGKTAAVLLSFIAMCKRNAVEPFACFRDVLTRVATHPISRIEPEHVARLENEMTRQGEAIRIASRKPLTASVARRRHARHRLRLEAVPALVVSGPALFRPHAPISPGAGITRGRDGQVGARQSSSAAGGSLEIRHFRSARSEHR